MAAADPSRIVLSAPDLGQAERDALLATFDDGWISSAAPLVERFEQAFAEAVGLEAATAVSSGTAALQLALHMLDLRPGDAVIAPTLTFIGGVAPIIHAGARPVFVDCSPADWNLDPDLLCDAFREIEREGLTARAIVPADLYGQCCDIAAIRAIADRQGVPVILDSAEAVGATLNGRPAGHGAHAAAYSFNGNKIISTGGGGMLASNDTALIARARHLATAARLPAVHYEHAEVGFNYRMTGLAAALGVVQLRSLGDKVARRRAIHAQYVRRLGSLAGVDFAPEAPGRQHTRWLTCMVMDREITGVSPDRLRLILEEAGVESRPLWKPMHMQPAFREHRIIGSGVAETLYANGLCLPSGSTLTDGQVHRVCDLVEAAVS